MCGCFTLAEADIDHISTPREALILKSPYSPRKRAEGMQLVDSISITELF